MYFSIASLSGQERLIAYWNAGEPLGGVVVRREPIQDITQIVILRGNSQQVRGSKTDGAPMPSAGGRADCGQVEWQKGLHLIIFPAGKSMWGLCLINHK